MLFSRILLFIQGTMGVVFGVIMLRDPASLAEFMGLQAISGDGTAELVTSYFGMSSAIGVYMLYAAITTRQIKEVTLFLAIFITGIASARLMSFFLFDIGSYTLSGLAYDVPMSVLCWIAVYRNRTGMKNPNPHGSD